MSDESGALSPGRVKDLIDYTILVSGNDIAPGYRITNLTGCIADPGKGIAVRSDNTALSMAKLTSAIDNIVSSSDNTANKVVNTTLLIEGMASPINNTAVLIEKIVSQIT